MALPALRLALASALEAYCTERGRTLAEVVAAMDWRSRGKLGKQEVMALVRTLMQGAAAPSDEDMHALAMDAVGAGADGEVGVEQLRDYLDSARRPPPPDDGDGDDAPAGPAADPFPVVPPVEPPWVANLVALPADAAPHARMHGHFLANERRAHLVRTSVAQRTARAARRIAAVELAHTEVLTDAPLINASYEITIPPDNSDADPDVHYAVARNERAAWRATSRHAPPTAAAHTRMLGEPLAPLADRVEHVVVAEVVAVRAGAVAVALVEPVGVVLVPSLVVVLLRRFDLGVHGRRRARGLDDGRAVAEVGGRERGGRSGGRARR